jgi:hypothetical protein
MSRNNNCKIAHLGCNAMYHPNFFLHFLLKKTNKQTHKNLCLFLIKHLPPTFQGPQTPILLFLFLLSDTFWFTLIKKKASWNKLMQIDDKHLCQHEVKWRGIFIKQFIMMEMSTDDNTKAIFTTSFLQHGCRQPWQYICCMKTVPLLTFHCITIPQKHRMPLSTETTYLPGVFSPEDLSFPLTPASSGFIALLWNKQCASSNNSIQ